MSCCTTSRFGSVLLGAVAGGIFALIGASALSQNTTKDMKDAGKQAVKDAKDAAKDAAKNAGDKAKEAMGGQPEMPPEMAKMMEAWGNYATPTETHAHMMKGAGKWSMKTKMRFTPDMPWDESTSQIETTSIMGGRYLFEKVNGSAGGQPFEGMNIIGYDNFKKKHFYSWIDNMGTGVFYAEGDMAADGKSITYWSEGPDFMTGKMKKTRSVMKYDSDDQHTIEMYDNGPDGKEFLSFVGVSTRVK